MIPSPVNLSTVPPYRCTTTDERSTSSAMISRNRSAPTAAAISIECTTSANSNVTCLYSADVAAGLIGALHLLQNRESGGSSVPHDPHTKAAAVMSRGTPLAFTSISCHRRSDLSVISPQRNQRQGWQKGHLVLDARRPVEQAAPRA